MLLPSKAKNRRQSPAVRQERKAQREKVDVARHPARVQEHELLGMKRWIGILVLTPVVLVTIITMMEMFWRLVTRHGIWQTEEFRFFVLGVVAWLTLYFAAGVRPVRLYVFGHELSHALAAVCTGGKIYDFDFGSDGGYVETDKTSTFISLAPYLIPIHALGVMLVFGAVALFVDLFEPYAFEVAGVVVPFKVARLFHAGLGLTWAFHVTYTILTLRRQQSDLTRNGEFFSVMLITLVNAGLLTLMFVAASPHPELGLAQTARCWWGVLTRFLPWLA